MSEEQNQNLNEQNSDRNVIATLAIISLIFSIAALTISTYQLVGSSSSAAGGRQIVISKKYDKGQTLAKAEAKNKPMLVLFYTDWCGYSQKFAPTFDKIAKDRNIKKKFAVAYVNCDNEENRAIMEEYKVDAFPTLFVVNEFGEKKQIPNDLFFNDDSKEVLIKRINEIVEE